MSMRKMMGFFSALFLVFHIAGCSSQPSMDYDAVQMTLIMSSTAAGQPQSITDPDVIDELWDLCQESQGHLGQGQSWELQFFNSEANTEKTYRVFEDQDEIYDELTQIYNQYFNVR